VFGRWLDGPLRLAPASARGISLRPAVGLTKESTVSGNEPVSARSGDAAKLAETEFKSLLVSIAGSRGPVAIFNEKDFLEAASEMGVDVVTAQNALDMYLSRRRRVSPLADRPPRVCWRHGRSEGWNYQRSAVRPCQ
jgi:hypothetical protein